MAGASSRSQSLAAEPKLEVRLAASTEYARISNDDFDVDVVYGQPRGEEIQIIPLGEETVTPLCSPDIAKRFASRRTWSARC